MEHVRRSIIIASAAASLVFGCGRAAPQAPRTSPAAWRTPDVATPDRPAEAVGGGPRDVNRPFAEAKCAQIMRCGGTGPNGAFASENDCVEFVEDSGVDEIGIAICGPGVDDLKMQTCMNAIRGQECDDTATPPACRPAALCGR